MWGCPDWDMTLNLKLNLTAWLPVIVRFIEISEECKLDGLLLEMPGPGYGDSVEALGHTTARVLRFLSSADSAGRNRMAEEIEDQSWWFSFGGQKLFVLTFGPCYSCHNSRYGFETTYTYLVLQPIHCFSRRIPDGATQRSQRVRRQIRHRYQASGRPYDLAITLSPFEAHRYVKPASLGDPPIKWWHQAGDPD
ncbi:MAG TPA: YqcI/YcgG family protein [Streptosporangiaceae bacterium]